MTNYGLETFSRGAHGRKARHDIARERRYFRSAVRQIGVAADVALRKPPEFAGRVDGAQEARKIIGAARVEQMAFRIAYRRGELPRRIEQYHGWRPEMIAGGTAALTLKPAQKA